jgi:hypothetical protein
MEYEPKYKHVGNEWHWELRVNIPALMTSDRQVAKGVAKSKADATVAMGNAQREYASRYQRDSAFYKGSK